MVVVGVGVGIRDDVGVCYQNSKLRSQGPLVCTSGCMLNFMIRKDL